MSPRELLTIETEGSWPAGHRQYMFDATITVSRKNRKVVFVVVAESRAAAILRVMRKWPTARDFDCYAISFVESRV